MTKIARTLTVDVAIPAYNEERSIAHILQDVVSAHEADWFNLRTIYVISDASTDRTNDIVDRFRHTDQRVTLIQTPERRGKNHSINHLTQLTDADVLIFLDADVRLADANVLRYLLEPIHAGQARLVGATVIPANPGASVNASMLARGFDALLEAEKRRRKPLSYWSFYGRAFALSRDLYQDLVLPEAHADDQFIYYSCLRSGYAVAHATPAVVYFQSPTSIGDFVDQYSRFLFWTDMAREEFGDDLVDADMRVRGMRRVLLASFVRHPYSGLAWAMCQLVSRIAYLTGHRTALLKRGLYKTWTSWEQSNFRDATAARETVASGGEDRRRDERPHRLGTVDGLPRLAAGQQGAGQLTVPSASLKLKPGGAVDGRVEEGRAQQEPRPGTSPAAVGLAAGLFLSATVTSTVLAEDKHKAEIKLIKDEQKTETKLAEDE